MWVTLNGATNNVAQVTPAGVVTEFDLPGVSAPSGITATSDSLWVTQNAGVAKFSPADPVGTTVATAIANINTFHSITPGADGNLWVATVDHLIKVPPANPATFQDFPVAGLDPRDIDANGDGLAIASFGNKIVTATTAGATTNFAIAGGSQGVAGSTSGQIAFSQQGAAPTQFGLLTPPGSPVVTDSPGTDPFGVALGPDGAFWIAQFATDSLTRLTTDNQATPLSGFTAGSGPRQISPGPGNTLWVTLQTANKVGRVTGVEPASGGGGGGGGTAPETTLTKKPKKNVKPKGKRAKVKFKFSSDAGATFECALKKKGKKLKFRACTSPKTYKLKPGKYKFQVRASLGGLTGKPAKHKFKVVEA